MEVAGNEEIILCWIWIFILYRIYLLSWKMFEPRKLSAGFADWGANGGMMGAMMEMNGFRFLRLATSKPPTQPLSAEPPPSPWSQNHTGGVVELMEIKMHCKCGMVPDLADSSSRGLKLGGDWSWKKCKKHQLVFIKTLWSGTFILKFSLSIYESRQSKKLTSTLALQCVQWI